MVYQYVFEEGLEMSLVPDKDATPFASGPKVLELGLTGFTGRLIITQQALQQYSLTTTVQAEDDSYNDKHVDKDDGQSSSSSTESMHRLPQHQQHHLSEKPFSAGQDVSRSKQQTKDEANTATQQKPTPPTPSKAEASLQRRNAGVVPDPIDELAMVFCSSVQAPNNRQNVAVSVTQSNVDSVSTSSSSSYSGNSSVVEVVSVASSVSTRRHTSEDLRRGYSKEDTLDQLAAAFSTPASALPRNSQRSTVDISKIDESSRASSQAKSQQSHSTSSSRGEEDSSQRDSSIGTGKGDDDDPLAEFTTAFVALSTGPPKKDVEGGSIDASSNASAAPSLVSSSGSSSASSSSDGSVSEPQRRSGNTNKKSVDDDDNDETPEDPLTEFTNVFGQLTSAEQERNKNMGVDEESSAATSSGASSAYRSARSTSAHSSSISSVGEERRHRPSQQESLDDPLSDFAAAFGELSNTEKKPKQVDVIDESSRASSDDDSDEKPPSHSQTSTSQSDDPLTQFNKVYSEYSDDGEGPLSSSKLNTTANRAPEPPGAQEEQHRKKAAASINRKKSTAAKKRAASFSKKKGNKKASGNGNRRPSMSAERKQKIRDLFPTYPDVSTGSYGSLDPVGVYLHQKCVAPFERTLSPNDLRELLEVFPFAAYCADDKGRLPLHTLAENGALMQDPQGRQRATNLAKILIKAYPESVKYPDSDGMLPFVALVRDWIEVSYEDLTSDIEKELKGGTSGVAKKNTSRGSGQLGADGEYKSIAYDKLFPDTKMVPHVEWCLHMMSIVLDDMVGQGILKEALSAKNRQEQMVARHRYVGTIMASLPHLVKAVLFLDGGVGPVRKGIAQISFIRRALLSKGSIGGWLQEMALQKGQPSKLVIDYFHLLSNTTPEDYVGPKKSPNEDDVEAFHREKGRIYRTLEKMDLELPAS